MTSLNVLLCLTKSQKVHDYNVYDKEKQKIQPLEKLKPAKRICGILCVKMVEMFNGVSN